MKSKVITIECKLLFKRENTIRVILRDRILLIQKYFIDSVLKINERSTF